MVRENATCVDSKGVGLDVDMMINRVEQSREVDIYKWNKQLKIMNSV